MTRDLPDCRSRDRQSSRVNREAFIVTVRATAKWILSESRWFRLPISREAASNREVRRNLPKSWRISVIKIECGCKYRPHLADSRHFPNGIRFKSRSHITHRHPKTPRHRACPGWFNGLCARFIDSSPLASRQAANRVITQMPFGN